MRKPDTFIVGVPRAGTTSLFNYLGEHPEIFVPAVKTPNCFSEKPDPKFKKYHLNEEEYLKLYSGAGDEKRLVDATHYFHSEVAAKRIHSFNPEAKIIISLRNPVEVLYSHYVYRIGAGDKIGSFEEYLESMSPTREWEEENVKYVRNLKRFFSIFGQENVHVMVFDDFKEDPLRECQRIFDFLGVNPSFKPAMEVHNPGGISRKNMFLSKIMGFFPLGWRTKVIERFPAAVSLYQRIIFTSNDPPRLKPETERRLKDRFCREIQDLSLLLDRDLSHWVSD